MQIYRRKKSGNGYVFKVSQAAQMLGVTQDTLRRWEKKGKLAPQRTPGGTRLYSLDDLRRVNPDLKLTGSGFKLFKIPARLANLAVFALLIGLSFVAILSIENLFHSSTYQQPRSTLALSNAPLTQAQPDHEVLAAAIVNKDQILEGSPISSLNDSSLANNTSLDGNTSATWSISPEDCVKSYTSIEDGFLAR